MELELNKNKFVMLGFSLVEMAMVITIAGIIMAASAQVYSMYMKERHIRITYERMNKISEAMQDFYDSQGRYPCPSDPSAVDGIEDCSGFKTANAKDTLYNGLVLEGGAADDVLIGSVPYETLRLGLEDTNVYTNPPTSDEDVYAASYEVIGGIDAIDDWGRQVTYVVSEALTNQATFKAEYESINVTTEDGISLVNPAAAWVLISHGDDGAGAYTSEGELFKTSDCLGYEATAASDNCDLNPGAGEFTVISGLRNLVRGTKYFDDIVVFSQANVNGFWEAARNDPSGAHSSAARDITNTNKGFVGVGTRHPLQSLDIRYGALQADKVTADKICNQDGSKCIDPNNFVDECPGASCPSSRILKGITSAGVLNYDPIVPPTVTLSETGCVDDVVGACNATSKDCNTGYYVLGINSSGFIICGTP